MQQRGRWSVRTRVFNVRSVGTLARKMDIGILRYQRCCGSRLQWKMPIRSGYRGSSYLQWYLHAGWQKAVRRSMQGA
jgi:hypothetical protein